MRSVPISVETKKGVSPQFFDPECFVDFLTCEESEIDSESLSVSRIRRLSYCRKEFYFEECEKGSATSIRRTRNEDPSALQRFHHCVDY
jgi:hypothetical protein